MKDHHIFSVQLTFRVSGGPIPDVTNEEIADVLAKSGRLWDEGRYPFEYEMMHQGVAAAVRGAISAIVRERMAEKYRGEMVISDDGATKTARYWIEHEKIVKDLYVGVDDTIQAAVVTDFVREDD